MRSPYGTWWTLAAAAVFAAGCAADAPRDIAYGQEPCGYCRMTITDRRFGAEVRTATGRVLAFDSVECLAAYVHAADPSDVHGVWVTDHARPGTFVAADSAAFWQADGGASPMGKGLLATTRGRRPTVVTVAGPLEWDAVVELVALEGLRGDGATHAH